MAENERYGRIALIVLIVGLGVLLFREMLPFIGGILGAFTLYVLVRRQMLFLTEVKKWKANRAALLLLGEIVLVVLIPLSLAIWLFIHKLQHFNLDTAAIISAAQHVSDLIREKTGYDIFNMDNVVTVATLLPKIGQSLMGSISSFAINAVTLLFVLYFMLVSIRPFETYVYALLPFNAKNKERMVNEISVLVKSNAIGIPLLAVIQGAIATLGYFIFQVPQPFLFGVITCVATVIPIVGTGLVWLPLAAYLALTGDWFNAIGLAIYALLVISNIDNLIRFMLQKQMANTHPLITIFGVVIGLSLFGFIGIIFGPILIAVFLLCVTIFKEEYL